MSASDRRAPAQGTSAGPQLVLVNGRAPRPGAPISPLDRGLHFGDGLFETLACRNGRARFLDLHLQRLTEGCRRLRLPIGDLDAVREEIVRAAADEDASLIKLLVSRGEAIARGYAWAGSESVTRILLRYGWPAEDPAKARDGVTARVAPMRVGENPALAGMKHLNRLEQVIARSQVPAAEADEVILFSSSGQLVSGTMSNVFVVRDEQVFTPRIDVAGVCGVMRRVVLREASRAGLSIEERVLRENDLDAAHEVFLTNARIGIWPVRRLDSRELQVGEITRRLQAALAPLLDKPADA